MRLCVDGSLPLGTDVFISSLRVTASGAFVEGEGMGPSGHCHSVPLGCCARASCREEWHADLATHVSCRRLVSPNARKHARVIPRCASFGGARVFFFFFLFSSAAMCGASVALGPIPRPQQRLLCGSTRCSSGRYWGLELVLSSIKRSLPQIVGLFGVARVPTGPRG